MIPHTHTHKHTCTHTNTHSHTHTHIHTHTHAHYAHTLECECVSVSDGEHACLYVCVGAYILICVIYGCARAHVFMRAPVHACV